MRRVLLASSGTTASGLGAPVALALLLPMEAGIPIPIPADLVMLLIGERAADGSFPLWAAVLALEVIAVIGCAALFLVARGPGHALIQRVGPRVGLTHERLDRATALVERRGTLALAVGRGTPGLRTVTCVAAGSSGMTLRRALLPLVIGSSVFLQLHLLLGYFLGPAARELIEDAKGPAILLALLLLAAAAVYWFVRRRRRSAQRADGVQAAQQMTEAACPLCLALNWALERAVDGYAVSGVGTTSTGRVERWTT
jgi:membrane protein DedA with SNARE-associated domain